MEQGRARALNKPRAATMGVGHGKPTCLIVLPIMGSCKKHDDPIAGDRLYAAVAREEAAHACGVSISSGSTLLRRVGVITGPENQLTALMRVKYVPTKV